MDLEISFLLASFHSAWRCYDCYWGRKVIINHIQIWAPWTTVMTGLERHVYWCNSGMNIMGVTIHFPIGFKAWLIRWNTYLAPLKGKTKKQSYSYTDHRLSEIAYYYCFSNWTQHWTNVLLYIIKLRHLSLFILCLQPLMINTETWPRCRRWDSKMFIPERNKYIIPLLTAVETLS